MLARRISSLSTSRRHATRSMASTQRMSPSTDVLSRVRKHMQGVDAIIVPSADAHQSEYAASCDARRAYVSGFTGSAGTAVIFASSSGAMAPGARLWTDGRYFLQAEEELSDEWELMRVGVDGVLDVKGSLLATLEHGARVGIDATVHTVAAAEALKKALDAEGIELVPLEKNPVDAAWEEDGA